MTKATFRIADISFVLSLVGSNLGIDSFDLALTHDDGESTVFMLQLYRGEWFYHGERGDSPLHVHALALDLIARFNACGYWRNLLAHHPYSVESMVSEALGGYAQAVAS